MAIHDDNVSARAILLTPESSVLLMRKGRPSGDIWITPGGRVRPGETLTEALARELREETGLRSVESPVEVWTRFGSCLTDGEPAEEREHIFLVRTDAFDPTPDGMEPAERSLHWEFRWWPVRAIVASSCSFIPRLMGNLLIDLERDGPPAVPLVIEETP